MRALGGGHWEVMVRWVGTTTTLMIDAGAATVRFGGFPSVQFYQSVADIAHYGPTRKPNGRREIGRERADPIPHRHLPLPCGYSAGSGCAHRRHNALCPVCVLQRNLLVHGSTSRQHHGC